VDLAHLSIQKWWLGMGRGEEYSEPRLIVSGAKDM